MSFVASSQDVWLEHGHILHAKCEDVEGNLVDSTIDLNYYIGNSDGKLSWLLYRYLGSRPRELRRTFVPLLCGPAEKPRILRYLYVFWTFRDAVRHQVAPKQFDT